MPGWNYGSHGFISLGFSDLTDDEAFVVAVFRHWQSCGVTCDEAESNLTELLRDDRLHNGLLSLFDLLGTLPDRHRRTMKNDSAVLTSVGEALLDGIGWTDEIGKRCVKAPQQLLEEAGTTIRPAPQIPRSGYDRLVETIDQKAAKMYEALYC